MSRGRVYFPFLLGAVVGSGFLIRKLIRSGPEIMERITSRIDRCKQVMEEFGKSQELAAYATPELRALFEDWIREMESEILEFIKAKKKASPPDIATKFNISLESAVFLVNKLASKGKLKFGRFEVTE